MKTSQMGYERFPQMSDLGLRKQACRLLRLAEFTGGSEVKPLGRVRLFATPWTGL